MIKFHARGKLLLTGEYVVLDGAKALAVPTFLGQELHVQQNDTKEDFRWTSKTKDHTVWLAFNWPDFPNNTPHLITGNQAQLNRLVDIFHSILELNTASVEQIRGYHATTVLQFDQNWGLGSSSTLISLLSRWLGVDPFILLKKTFGGSGYDVACAQATGPIQYFLMDSRAYWTELNWEPGWLEDSFFVFRNKKQNSREGIKRYRQKEVDLSVIQHVDYTTAVILRSRPPVEVLKLLRQHEELIGQLIGLTPVQQEYFPDFPGVVKSLGAWGGDFVWAIPDYTRPVTPQYFHERGFPIVIPWKEMTKLPKAYYGQKRRLGIQRSPILDR